MRTSVQVFSEDTIDDLDDAINTFIQREEKGESDFEVVDIKFSTCVYEDGNLKRIIFSALLIYEFSV